MKLTSSRPNPISSTGAGFYLNATSEKYKKHYRMYDLIAKEIPGAIKEEGLPIVSPTRMLSLIPIYRC